jgi:DNA-binding SARP family transcriptional activator/predicted ATPase
LKGAIVVRLHLSLLGSFQATVDGQAAPGLHSERLRALLAVLAVDADTPHTRQALAALLWPEQADTVALSNLRYTLSDLRHALGDTPARPPLLLVTRESIRLDPDAGCWLDVREFERFSAVPVSVGASRTECKHLEQAAALYRGPFLEGLTLPGSPAFEEWLFWTREQFQHKMMGVLRRLVAYYELAGHYEAAQVAARRQVQLEPLDEEAHRQLMHALALDGRRSAALVEYERCRHLLAQELEVEPADETVALAEAIRAGALEPIAHSRDHPWTGTDKRPSEPAPPSPGVAPVFVGRERELAQLEYHLTKALDGHGRVVFVTGDAGSGKTALLQEFVRRAMAFHADLVAADGSCNAAAGIGDPYLPFRDVLQMLSGDIEAKRAGNTITPEHARRLWALLPYSVQALVEKGSDLVDLFVPAAPLLLRAEAVMRRPDSATCSATYRTRLAELVRNRSTLKGRSATGQEDLFEQVVRVLCFLSAQRPLLLVIDDLQWADRGTAALLFHLGRHLAGSRILLACAYRPQAMDEGEAAGGTAVGVRMVIHELLRQWDDDLVDLDQADGWAFIEAYVDREPNRLGTNFRQALYDHTGGNPLFTVELLRSFVREGALVQDGTGHWVEAHNLNWECWPPQVEAVIAAHLAALPEEEQALLRAASVQGQQFIAEVVARVVERSEAAVVKCLSGALSTHHRLVGAASVDRLASSGQRLSTYRFRHWLFQHYLYGRLDPVERVALHESTGRALEALYGAQAGELAVELARHFEAAGLVDKAVGYLLQAGKRAMEMSVHFEAVQQFRRGLALLSGLPHSPERDRQELDLQLALGSTLLATEGMGSRAQILAYSRAYELSGRLGEQVALWPALHALASSSIARGQSQKAFDLGEQLLTLAQRSADPMVLALAHFTLGAALFSSGSSLPRAREHLEQAIRYYDEKCDHPSRRYLTSLNLFDLGVNARAWLANVLWILGYPDQALQRSQQALDMVQRLDHFMSQVLALYAACHAQMRQGDDHALARAVQALAQLVRGKHLVVGEAWVAVFGGWLLVRAGQAAEGLAQLRQGTETWQKTGAVFGTTAQMALLAEACVLAGQVEEGLEVVGRTLALVARTDARPNEAELHRLRGELLLARGDEADTVEAEACFRRSIALAHAGEQKGWELRAAMSLARLCLRKGYPDREEARTLLAEVYAWFSEGFDTSDLQAAKALLAQ